MEADRTPETTSEVAARRVAQVRERLRHRAWVFDDPRSYTAGVEEALQALAALPSASRRSLRPTSSERSGLQSNTA